jgi:hypothetical protein
MASQNWDSMGRASLYFAPITLPPPNFTSKNIHHLLPFLPVITPSQNPLAVM